jgi:hypothetical protein
MTRVSDRFTATAWRANSYRRMCTTKCIRHILTSVTKARFRPASMVYMIAADNGDVADAAAHLLGWAAVGCTTSSWNCLVQCLTDDGVGADDSRGRGETPTSAIGRRGAHARGGHPGYFDMLIVDQAHHCAPPAPARSTRLRHRQRQTQAVRRVGEHSQHRLLLSATPHNESWQALLEMRARRPAGGLVLLMPALVSRNAHHRDSLSSE